MEGEREREREREQTVLSTQQSSLGRVKFNFGLHLGSVYKHSSHYNFNFYTLEKTSHHNIAFPVNIASPSFV